ncbi:hypothetical protein JB92DRAFT_3103358 [Gautieria morchelliformis]|nr:hypothetical protein JB92DRAFT_3103358 [Gautieria morchelliformis]
MQVISDMDEAELLKVKGDLAQGSAAITADGRNFQLTPDLLTIKQTVVTQSMWEFIPNVIEPLFGLGHILYMLLEHSFWTCGDDEKKGVLLLPILVAPIKVLIVTLSAKEELKPLVQEVSAKLRREGVFSRVDDSTASIELRISLLQGLAAETAEPAQDPDGDPSASRGSHA